MHAPLEMDHVWSRLLWFPMYTLLDVGAGISMRRSESLRATEGASLCIAVNKILISQQVSFVEVWSMYAWDCTIWFCQVELYKLLNCLHIIEQLLVLQSSQDPRSFILSHFFVVPLFSFGGVRGAGWGRGGNMHVQRQLLWIFMLQFNWKSWSFLAFLNEATVRAVVLQWLQKSNVFSQEIRKIFPCPTLLFVWKVKMCPTTLLVLLHKTTTRKRGLLQNPHWKRFSEISFLKIVPSTLYVEGIPPMNLKHN